MIKLYESAYKDGVRVRVVSDHPHTGKTGTIKGNEYTSQLFPEMRLFRIVPDDGGDEFFASPYLGQLELLK